MDIKAKMGVISMVFMAHIGIAYASINTTQITDSMNAIWVIVDNIGDHVGSIITLVLLGVIVGVLYIIKKFLSRTLSKAADSGGKD